MSYQLVEDLQKKAASSYLEATFAAGQKADGSRRLRRAMGERGLAMGRHRVRTLMRLNGLRPVWRREFIDMTDRKHSMAIYRNVLNRHLEQALSNQVWVCDITYIRTRSGWPYLAAVPNSHSRKIVGWTMAAAMPAEQVCAALLESEDGAGFAEGLRQSPRGNKRSC